MQLCLSFRWRLAGPFVGSSILLGDHHGRTKLCIAISIHIYIHTHIYVYIYTCSVYIEYILYMYTIYSIHLHLSLFYAPLSLNQWMYRVYIYIYISTNISRLQTGPNKMPVRAECDNLVAVAGVVSMSNAILPAKERSVLVNDSMTKSCFTESI